MLSVLVLALVGAGPDSAARLIGLAPAESLQVTVTGPVSGVPVVIVPGLVSPAYAFRKVMPPLAAAGIRVIVIEPLGVGWSSHPSDSDYSHTAQARRLAAVMDTLHVHGAVVLGQAVGASMALRLALARPDLVSKLLLVEEGAVESPAVPGVRSALKFSLLIRLFAGRGRIKKELRKGLIASSGDASWVTDSVIDAYTEGPSGDIGAVLRALKGMQNSVEPDSLRPHLHELRMPVRLLVGGAAHRSGIAPARLRDLQELVPHFSMQVVYGAGLHIQEEQPDVIVGEVLHLTRDHEPHGP
jgi:pimeloyl-ACP methyl ester carboxylesterase